MTQVFIVAPLASQRIVTRAGTCVPEQTQHKHRYNNDIQNRTHDHKTPYHCIRKLTPIALYYLVWSPLSSGCRIPSLNQAIRERLARGWRLDWGLGHGS